MYRQTARRCASTAALLAAAATHVVKLAIWLATALLPTWQVHHQQVVVVGEGDTLDSAPGMVSPPTGLLHATSAADPITMLETVKLRR